MIVKLYSKNSTLSMTAILIAVFLVVLDFNMIGSMLPFIAKELNISYSNSIWIINIYQLVMFVTLIFFSKLSNLLGYKYLFLLGLLIFTLSSLLCFSADSFKEILIFRALQSLGASILTSINIAMIKNIYSAKRIGHGIALSAFIVAIASSAAPMIASSIISYFSWSYIFLVSTLIGFISLILSLFYIESDFNKKKLDKIPISLTFNLFTYLLIGSCIILISQSNNLALPLLVLLIIIGTFFKSLFFKTLQIKFIVNNKLKVSFLTTLIFFFSQSLSFTTLPFYLHQVLLQSINSVSFHLTTWAISVAISAFSSGFLSHRFSPKVISGIGTIFFTLGLILLFYVQVSTPHIYISYSVFLCGMGFGLFQSSNLLYIMNSTSSDDSALTSGLLSTVRLLAQLSGAAFFSFLVSNFDNSGLKYALLVAFISSFITIFLCFKDLESKNHINRSY